MEIEFDSKCDEDVLINWYFCIRIFAFVMALKNILYVQKSLSKSEFPIYERISVYQIIS